MSPNLAWARGQIDVEGSETDNLGQRRLGRWSSIASVSSGQAGRRTEGPAEQLDKLEMTRTARVRPAARGSSAETLRSPLPPSPSNERSRSG